MHLLKYMIAAGGALASAALVHSAVLNVNNLNDAETNAYGLTDSAGNLLTQATGNSIRVGYFTGMGNSDITNAWNAGDIAGLDAAFVTFASAFGISTLGDGIVYAGPSAYSDPFDGQSIYLWAATGSGFASTDEHLIYQFDDVFVAEPWFPVGVFLGVSSGSLLVGNYGLYSYDLSGVGEGVLPCFSTATVIPEPSTVAALLGLGVLGLAIIIRRRAR